MIQVRTLVVGELETNGYIVFADGEKEAAIIDPGGEGERILRELKENNVGAKYIINTHGHIDHTSANLWLSKATGAQILIHKDDVKYLEDPVLGLKMPFGQEGDTAPPDRILEDGETICVGSLKFKVIHTPGHTPGGIALSAHELEENNARCLFTGDTLFKNGIGRTDLPGGSYQRLMDSIVSRLLTFSDETVIYPGHGPASTIGQERKNNPFLGGLNGRES